MPIIPSTPKKAYRNAAVRAMMKAMAHFSMAERVIAWVRFLARRGGMGKEKPV
jgi:hypothetical protein